MSRVKSLKYKVEANGSGYIHRNHHKNPKKMKRQRQDGGFKRRFKLDKISRKENPL